MESNSDVQFLSERAWDLVNKVNDEIIGSKESVSFCKLCSENGHLCGIVAETPSWEEDKEGLVAIRDSLKDVQHILEFVQKLQSSQKGHQLLALAKLEERRMTLIGKVNEYNANGRKLSVIEEINARFDKDLENDDDDLKIKRNKSWNCIRSLFNPSWLVIKLIVVSISISSSYKFYNGGRLEYKKSEGEQQRLVWPLDLVKGRKHGFGFMDPNSPLDVLHGRG